MLKFLASLVAAIIAVSLLAVSSGGPIFSFAAILALISIFALIVTLLKDARQRIGA